MDFSTILVLMDEIKELKEKAEKYDNLEKCKKNLMKDISYLEKKNINLTDKIENLETRLSVAQKKYDELDYIHSKTICDLNCSLDKNLNLENKLVASQKEKDTIYDQLVKLQEKLVNPPQIIIPDICGNEVRALSYFFEKYTGLRAATMPATAIRSAEAKIFGLSPRKITALAIFFKRHTNRHVSDLTADQIENAELSSCV